MKSNDIVREESCILWNFSYRLLIFNRINLKILDKVSFKMKFGMQKKKIVNWRELIRFYQALIKVSYFD